MSCVITAELMTFKEMLDSRQLTATQRNTLRHRFGGKPAASKVQKEQSKTAQQLKLAFR